MVVLVTGSGGLLGAKLVRELVGRGYEVVAIYRSSKPLVEGDVDFVRLDITDWVRLEDLVLKKKPEVIIHAAAYTDVDGCEIYREKAWRVNVEGTKSIVRVSRVVNAHLVYISTDYIFDGEKGLYREDDIPSPINYYGLTKLVGEELVKSSGLLYTIVRPSAIYGLGGSKKSFAEFVVEQLSSNKKIKAIVDQYVSPTLNTLLAEAVAEIVNLRPLGILHVAGPVLSRYEFATKIARKLDLPVDLIEKAKLDDFRDKWVAKRPRNSSLDTSKARSILRTPFYDIEYALELFSEEWKNRIVSS